MNPFDEPNKVAVAPIGKTKDLNLTFNMFFDESKFQARFLALYVEKTIIAVGKISDVVRRHPNGRIESFGPVSIYPACIEAMKVLSGEFEAKMDREPHFFYIVENFEPTQMVKTNPFGLPRTRIFSITELAGLDESTDSATDFALRLKGQRHPLGGKK